MTQDTTATPPREPGLYERHAQTVLLAIATAAILGCFKFLWSLNATVTKVQEQIYERTVDMDKIQNGVNELRLDMQTTKSSVQDVRERMIRVEIETNKSP